MKVYNGLIVRILVIFILWVGEMSACMAQSDGCGGRCNAAEGEECFSEMLDVDGYVTPISPGLCLSETNSGLGTSYCVLPGTGLILEVEGLGGCSKSNRTYTRGFLRRLRRRTFFRVF